MKTDPNPTFPSYKNASVAELVPYARNARTHSDAQVDKVAASIREFGFLNPIITDGSNGIISGHCRVLAAQKLGIMAVPTVEAAHLTEAQKRAYIIADNRLALDAGWDNDLLRIELGELAEFDFDLSLTGFSEAELSPFFVNDAAPGEEDAPEPPADPVSVLGDVWLLGRHRLLCGDSTSADAVGAVLAGVKPHLMVTDPPYGVSYDPEWRASAGINKNKAKMGKVQNDDRADWREAWALFPGDVGYVWHGALHAGEVADSLIASGFAIRAQIVWAKDRFALSRGHYHWQHEPCWYVVRGQGHWNGDRKQSTLWNIPARDDSGVGHGTQKPVECMRRPVLNNSSPGQAVYEPFSGSGTTIIACEMEGRACLAIELDPAYIDVAVQRWQFFAGAEATLESTGQTFAELETERCSAAA